MKNYNFNKGDFYCGSYVSVKKITNLTDHEKTIMFKVFDDDTLNENEIFEKVSSIVGEHNIIVEQFSHAQCFELENTKLLRFFHEDGIMALSPSVIMSAYKIKTDNIKNKISDDIESIIKPTISKSKDNQEYLLNLLEDLKIDICLN